MRTLLHVAHGVIIGIGAIAVLATLLPSTWRYRRAVNRLRTAAGPDELVQLAEQRALAELQRTTDGTRGRAWLVLAALASVTAAAIHGAVGPEHFREALRLGMFFVLICAAQLALAAALLRRPTRTIVVTTIVVNAGTVVLWLLTRTCGLPFNLAEIEPFGVLDTVSSAAELMVAGCCLRWLALSRSEASAARRPPRHTAFALSAHRPEGI